MEISFIKLNMQRYKLNNRLVYSFALNSRIKNIIEMGSGNRSTFLIRNAIKNKGFGFCLSLENDVGYYTGLTKKLPNSSFGSIEFSPLIYDDGGLHYSCVLNDQYDFIYIDGPGTSLYIDKKDGMLKESSPLLYDFLSLPQNWLNSNSGMSMGGGRIFMLDYVKNVIHDDTIIMIDCSGRAMIHFFQNYRDIYDFYSFGKLISKRKIKNIIKPEYLETFIKTDYWPGRVNIVLKKKSKNAIGIINEVLSHVISIKNEPSIIDNILENVKK